MKNTFLSTILFSLTVFSIISFNACSKKDCDNVSCQNNGTVDDDCNCTCALGYEGVTCETKTIQKFVMTNKVFNDACGSPIGQSQVTITADATDATKATVFNILDNGRNLNAQLNSNGKLIIPEQTFTSGTITTKYSGSVVDSVNKFFIFFKVTNGSSASLNCVSVTN